MICYLDRYKSRECVNVDIVTRHPDAERLEISMYDMASPGRDKVPSGIPRASEKHLEFYANFHTSNNSPMRYYYYITQVITVRRYLEGSGVSGLLMMA